MPELPEVETLKRELAPVLAGKTVRQVEVSWTKMVKPLSVAQFKRRLAGQKMVAVERRAKVLIITLDSGSHLMVHLKMTGQLIFKPKKGQVRVGGHPQPGGLDNLPNNYTRIIFYFTDGDVLFFNDLRKFGWIKLVSPTEKDRLLAGIGVEPLTKTFTLKLFTELLQRYPNRNLKQFLLDQTLIAGLGNIYVDESCFLAKVLPTRIIKTLTKLEIARLHDSIIKVLKHSISKKGTSSKNYRRSDGSLGGFVPYLNVYGRGRQKCKRCRGTITKIKFAGRGTHFCSGCQK